MSVVIQHCSSNSLVLQLATACVARCLLKVCFPFLAKNSNSYSFFFQPVVVNRLLQNVIQHPHFARHASIQSMDGGLRDALIELLHVLFNLHPNNTCQITHVEPLIGIYRGTLSISDLRILSIFQLFESQRKLSVAPLLSLWSASSDSTSTSALEALQSLDPGTVFKTCLNFPQWRRVQYQASANSHVQDSRLYDPVFLLLLFGHMIGEQTPSSNFAWVDLLRTNVASLFLRALSAKDEQIRELALCQVVALWRKLEVCVRLKTSRIYSSQVLRMQTFRRSSTCNTSSTWLDIYIPPRHPRLRPSRAFPHILHFFLVTLSEQFSIPRTSFTRLQLDSCYKGRPSISRMYQCFMGCFIVALMTIGRKSEHG